MKTLQRKSTINAVKKWWQAVQKWNDEQTIRMWHFWNSPQEIDRDNIEEWHSAIFDILLDLAKIKTPEAKELLKRGKRLYNAHALSPYR